MLIPARQMLSGNECPAFQIDECFAHEVMKYKWRVGGCGVGYLRTTVHPDRETVEIVDLHKLIWSLSGRPKCDAIDHINGDTLDNRLENLRPATVMLNMKNRRRRKSTALGLPMGVRENGQGYAAQVNHRGLRHHLGTFDTPEEAHAAYKDAREVLLEFAALPGFPSLSFSKGMK